MFVIPAIDIKGGKCVRLLKGNFSKQTNYNDSPYDQAKVFSKFGFNYLHLIDLDGALTGKIVNKKIIEQILSIPEIKLQVGGGVRSFEQIDDLFQLGVHNVILGTKAVDDLDFLETACKKFSKKIILSLDVRNGYLALSGWKRQTNISASEFIKKVEGFNISKIIYTDIDRDGTKSGPNIDATLAFSNLTEIPIIFSGGVSSLQDVKNINKKKTNKIIGVIVGKAIYDKSIDLKELSNL